MEVTSLDRASASVDATDDLSRPTEFWLEEAWRLEDQNRIAESIALARRGLEIAEASGNADLVVDLRAHIARAFHTAGDFRNAVETATAGLPWLQACTDDARRSNYLSVLAARLGSLGEVDKAVGYLRQAHDAARRAGHLSQYLVWGRSGELRMMLGFASEAVADFRMTYELGKRLTGADATAHRTAGDRIELATAMLLNAFDDVLSGRGDHRDAVEEAHNLLLEALPLAETVVLVYRRDALAALGLCRALLGIENDLTRVDVEADVSGQYARSEGWGQQCLIAWARFAALRGADAAFARVILDRIDPAQLDSTWVQWRPAWHLASAEIHAAAGRFEAACGEYRAFVEADKRNRDHQTALVFEMAERASEADEIRDRQREAAVRAERLAERNAALTAEKEQLAQSALTDPLTGLGNRRMLAERVDEARSRAGSCTCAVAIVDIDHFKVINDRFSHQVGDKVLAVVGGLLARSVREADVVVRWGGEEFVMLFRGLVGNRRLDGMRRSIERFDWWQIADGLAVTISIGAAGWTTSGRFEEAIALADKRLYAAKAAGRNRVVQA